MNEYDIRKKFLREVHRFRNAAAGNSLHHELVDTYNSNPNLPVGYKLKYSDAWCAATPSAASVRLGWTDVVLPECSCGRMIDLYKAAGRFVEDDGFIPKPGDLMFYDWQDSGAGDDRGYPDHVGTVESVANGTIYVFEGNVGGSTTTRAVPVNGKHIRGFACPDYASLADEDCRFDDVPSSHWAYSHIQWAAENRIAVGVSETEFAPDLPCTRSQALTMLWGMMGKPHPEKDFCPFKDVHKNDYFYKAVVWALETGITSGVSPSEFGSNQICTRGQIVTMLYNLAGSPYQEPAEMEGFGPGDYFYQAMLWASRHGVVAGTGNGLAPEMACTRAMIVTMLHRYADL